MKAFDTIELTAAPEQLILVPDEDKETRGEFKLSRRRYGHKMAKRIFPRNQSTTTTVAASSATDTAAEAAAEKTLDSTSYKTNQRRRYGQRIF